MLLHILNRSQSSSRVPLDTLRAMSGNDRLLLIEDGVYGAVGPLANVFAAIQGRVYALQEDLASRGLEDRRDPAIELVDMDGFVALTEQATQTVSWY
ncbi:sulfurtransferase complex subunit TusB [Halomonas sp. McH1-25]|uniref:sulfurtransferase complex subunit TusB n=1 Tax=unclassified Halomonas TaxID=2609666 RepID=UPI001EF5CFA2|nr:MULTISPECIES: sulfurtransferase complex subunit TusB [unclassified Halomonas]MCG7598430.1 sulfurtransferase complex subunit TusB [Halomonas sp. McH1-25]MCP1343766.1 sulfurtransferase complex subunit TusB [Halomonas sp. FL8]MCP1361745.1 sulfurtransferase complex subunit TusB [Halomonas sp. BBD45]MCP1366662.1 sulfurtransferase complex subunit TusB [Halomonas sp. BBD48]